jgi:hypothetical protein
MMLNDSKFPWALLSSLLVVGAWAVLSVFLLLGYQGELPHWGILIALLLATYFVSWMCALIIYLRWRDRRSLGTPVTAMDNELLADTVYGLVPGAEYQVMQTFTDHYQNRFERGERLHFKERHFLPYHGGHTIIFAERPLYLQEEENASIISSFSEYICRVK